MTTTTPTPEQTVSVLDGDRVLHLTGFRAHDTTARFTLIAVSTTAVPETVVTGIFTQVEWTTAYRYLFPILHGDPSDLMRSALPA